MRMERGQSTTFTCQGPVPHHLHPWSLGAQTRHIDVMVNGPSLGRAQRAHVLCQGQAAMWGFPPLLAALSGRPLESPVGESGIITRSVVFGKVGQQG